MTVAGQDSRGPLLPAGVPRQFHLLAKPTGAVCSTNGQAGHRHRPAAARRQGLVIFASVLLGAAFVFGWLVSMAIVVMVTVLATGNDPPEPGQLAYTSHLGARSASRTRQPAATVGVISKATVVPPQP